VQVHKTNRKSGDLLSGWLVVACVVVLTACSKTESPATPVTPDAEKAAMSIKVTSDAFTEGNPIPVEYTCDGSDISPPLAWSGVPANSKSLALICDDPDAPSGTFVHWVVYSIPAGETQLPKSVPSTPTLANGARQGKNGFGTIGYRGPCPPKGGPHRYFFHIYALDTTIDEAAGAARSSIDRAMKGHIIGEGHVMGTYQRK